jgi:hypothetical protein
MPEPKLTGGGCQRCWRAIFMRACATSIRLRRRQNRSAGFQTCRSADFQIGSACDVVRRAGLETGDTAGSEALRYDAAVPSSLNRIAVGRAGGAFKCFHGAQTDGPEFGNKSGVQSCEMQYLPCFKIGRANQERNCQIPRQIAAFGPRPRDVLFPLPIQHVGLGEVICTTQVVETRRPNSAKIARQSPH